MFEDALQTLQGWLSQAEVWLRDPVAAIAVLLGVLAGITLVSRLLFRWPDTRRQEGKSKS